VTPLKKPIVAKVKCNQENTHGVHVQGKNRGNLKKGKLFTRCSEKRCGAPRQALRQAPGGKGGKQKKEKKSKTAMFPLCEKCTRRIRGYRPGGNRPGKQKKKDSKRKSTCGGKRRFVSTNPSSRTSTREEGYKTKHEKKVK